MSDKYGVQPTGFVRKPLAVLLAEREQKNVEVFGPSVIQTPRSFFGQFNGIFAEIEAKLWEFAEEVYQSFDSDQAEGVRLENLARLRLIERQPGELDESLRVAISNADRANTRDADFYRALIALDGVTYARVFSNDENDTDTRGMGGHSVSVAAVGGDDEQVALTARRFIVPGVTSYGNTPVNTEIDGFCRTIRIMRPRVRPITISIDIRKYRDRFDCPPPANGAIIAALAANLDLYNGMTITRHVLQTAIGASFPNVEITDARIQYKEDSAELPAPVPFRVAFDELPTIVAADIDIGGVQNG